MKTKHDRILSAELEVNLLCHSYCLCEITIINYSLFMYTSKLSLTYRGIEEVGPPSLCPRPCGLESKRPQSQKLIWAK